MSKRTLSVTTKMSEEDFKLLMRAAEEQWPKVILSRSVILLGLAKIGAEVVLEAHSSPHSKKKKS